MARDVAAAVHAVIGAGADETMLQYIIGILEDEHFDWGDGGDGAFDVLGELLVDYGACANEDAARAACTKLAAQLAPATKPSSGVPGTRALGAAVALSDNDRAPLLFQVRGWRLAAARCAAAALPDGCRVQRKEQRVLPHPPIATLPTPHRNTATGTAMGPDRQRAVTLPGNTAIV